jgi:3-oxoacyl-[acyl-carrier protein] reductase
MVIDLHGRTALVTGAVQGIGRAVADALLAAGARVAALDLDADRVADAFASHGEQVLALGADVSDPAQVHEAVDRLESEWGDADILVNNAGRTVSCSIWDMTADEWDAVMATNLRSFVIFIQRCAPAMQAAGWGRIVNMASLAGQHGSMGGPSPHYAASKAGIIVLTKDVAREVASAGVTVNAVAPAAVRTPVMDGFNPELVAQFVNAIPVGRVGEANEVASLVTYLCSDAAAFVTGATMDINGGISMR